MHRTKEHRRNDMKASLIFHKSINKITKRQKSTKTVGFYLHRIQLKNIVVFILSSYVSQNTASIGKHIKIFI